MTVNDSQRQRNAARIVCKRCSRSVVTPHSDRLVVHWFDVAMGSKVIFMLSCICKYNQPYSFCCTYRRLKPCFNPNYFGGYPTQTHQFCILTRYIEHKYRLYYHFTHQTGWVPSTDAPGTLLICKKWHLLCRGTLSKYLGRSTFFLFKKTTTDAWYFIYILLE